MEHDDLYPIHVTVPGSAEDPRGVPDHDGIIVHYAPPLHPEEVVEVAGGLRVTSPARTLVDLASDMSRDELRATVARAREIGLLDMAAVHRSRARLEWRPSNAMLDSVIEEFAS